MARSTCAGLDRLVDWYLARGVDGLTILGQLGEAPEAHLRGIADGHAAGSRVGPACPVVVGVSSPGYASLAELTARSWTRAPPG